MPLPFLTADRAFDTADDLPLPFDDRDRWRRPYRIGPWRVGVAALVLLLASCVLFAAVIIGGTALTGGRGTVVGTFVGVLLLGIIGNGLVLRNISEFWQPVVTGAILLIAIILDRVRRHVQPQT